MIIWKTNALFLCFGKTKSDNTKSFENEGKKNFIILISSTFDYINIYGQLQAKLLEKISHTCVINQHVKGGSKHNSTKFQEIKHSQILHKWENE